MHNAAPSFIDTHCHLDMEQYQDDFHEMLDRTTQVGVDHILTIGIDYASSLKAVQLAKQHNNISATVGVHPHDVDSIDENTYNDISCLINENKKHIVGYGEIGLDYFKNYSDHEVQRTHFRKQLTLAQQHQLPVIIHDRDAHDDVLTILQESDPFTAGGVLHCFSGDYSFAKEVLALGFYVSIPGIVTFKNARDLQEVAQKLPLDRMLLETDGPFLAPHPHRGKRNESSYIPIIAEKIADLRGVDVLEVAQKTTENAKKLFNLN